MNEILVYSIGLGLAFYVAWCLGSNDAANSTSCSVGTNAISLKRALLLFGIFTALGAILQGHMVMKTIDRGIVSEITVLGAFATVMAVCIWVTFSSWRGMPVSTTHSIIGAVLGYGIIVGWASDAPFVILMVLIGMVASPILSMLLAMGLHSGVRKYFDRMAKKMPAEKVKRRMKRFTVAALCATAYAFGANDVGNATGVFVSATQKVGGIPGSEAMFLLALFAVVGITIGGFMLGRRVIETTGRRITRLTHLTAIPAEWADVMTVYLFTTLPFIIWGWGVPVSTTHASVGAIMGVGLLRGGTGIHRKLAGKIVTSWLVTLPATALMSMGLYEIISTFIVL